MACLCHRGMLRRLAGSSVSARACEIGGLDEPRLIFLSKESALKASVMPVRELAVKGGCQGGESVAYREWPVETTKGAPVRSGWDSGLGTDTYILHGQLVSPRARPHAHTPRMDIQEDLEGHWPRSRQRAQQRSGESQRPGARQFGVRTTWRAAREVSDGGVGGSSSNVLVTESRKRYAVGQAEDEAR